MPQEDQLTSSDGKPIDHQYKSRSLIGNLITSLGSFVLAQLLLFGPVLCCDPSLVVSPHLRAPNIINIRSRGRTFEVFLLVLYTVDIIINVHLRNNNKPSVSSRPRTSQLDNRACDRIPVEPDQRSTTKSTPKFGLSSRRCSCYLLDGEV
jgi:hypothetical protein